MVLEFSGEIVCGPEARPISPDQLEPGTEVTFQRGDAATVPPPVGEDTRDWPIRADQRRSRAHLMSGGHRGVCRDTRSVPGDLGRGRDRQLRLHLADRHDDAGRHLSDLGGRWGTGERRAARGRLGPDVDLLEIPELPKTIDAVFDQLERELTGDDFAADFDDELGYPTHVLVDRIADAVDDELEFYISDFTVTSTTTAGGSGPEATSPRPPNSNSPLTAGSSSRRRSRVTNSSKAPRSGSPSATGSPPPADATSSTSNGRSTATGWSSATGRAPKWPVSRPR